MKHLILLILLGCTTLLSSQEFETLFPDLTGQDLMEAVQNNYTTDSVMSYGMARDTLFANIFSKNDSLECVYSGWKRYLDPDLDPTQAVFTNNGDNEDINTEHSYPRSMGAIEGTPAHSDMHHLFPTRATVNSARGNEIFMDVPDNETQSWFFSNQTLSSPPTNNRDAWAEDVNGGFEPREEFKGDVARAIFYFYTIYQEQALNASSEFFELQRETLCHWTSNDPAEQDELIKTYQIAKYQGDIPNPFVVDCSLAERIYCQDVNNQVCITSTDDLADNISEWHLSPNPSNSNALIIESEGLWTHATLFDPLGNIVTSLPLSSSKHQHVITIDLVIPSGSYQVQLSHRLNQTKSEAKTWIRL